MPSPRRSLEIRRGTHVAPTKLTLGEFLNKRWLPRVKKQFRPTTYDLYETLVRRHLADREREPNLGALPLQELTADLIMELDDDLALGGRVRNGKGGLGVNSRRHIYFVLRRALNRCRQVGLPLVQSRPGRPSPGKAARGEADVDGRAGGEVPKRHRRRPFGRSMGALREARDA